MDFKEKKSWGEEIWEDKAKVQKEIGVIQGVRGSEQSIKKTTDKVMCILDSHFLKSLNGKDVLDAGVGPLARFSIEFCKRGYNVTGVDISDTTLNYAKKHIENNDCKNIKLIKNDLTSLDKVKGKFDLVFCAGTFGHIPSFLALNTLESFKRVLKKDGFCIIDFWIKKEKNFRMVFGDFIYWVFHLIKKGFNRKTFEVNCSYYTIEEIEEMVKRSGFKIIKRKESFFLLKKI